MSTQIDIGHGILADWSLPGNPVVIADRRVWSLHGHRIRFPHRLFTIDPGEDSKRWNVAGRLIDEILQSGVRRSTPVVVMGGGVAGDIGGFVAAVVLRGLPLIHVPTTLLAMVDSSIGGKTGVNHETGKNLIGSFHSPKQILMDLDTLETLPERERRCGLGEVLKYGMIHDATLLDADYATMTRWEPVIRMCAAYKSRIVEEDERETGIRAYLNYGHTFAHALEQVAGYGTLAHGEAVYVGLVAASFLANRLGLGVGPEELLRHRSLFPLDLARYESRVDDFMAAMNRDKKRMTDSIRFVLVETFGQPFLQDIDDTDAIRDAWLFALQSIHTDHRS
jgi:3-dehydroquinate synthase